MWDSKTLASFPVTSINMDHIIVKESYELQNTLTFLQHNSAYKV